MNADPTRGAAQKTTRLSLRPLNYQHGYPEAHAGIVWNGDLVEFSQIGGLARIATAFEDARRDASGTVVTLDNGDTFHSSYAVMKSRGAVLVSIMNALQFGAMTAHREFAYGPADFKALTGRLAYLMLAINCYEIKTGRLFFPPYRVLERSVAHGAASASRAIVSTKLCLSPTAQAYVSHPGATNCRAGLSV